MGHIYLGMNPEQRYYIARKWENGYIRAKRHAPSWSGVSRRKAKSNSTVSSPTDTDKVRIVDMNFKRLWPTTKQ